MLHLADGLVNVAFQLLWVAESLRMKHGSVVQEELGLMRLQGNKLIIRLRPMLSIWTVKGAWKECNPFRKAWKEPFPVFGFPPSVIGDNGQSTQLTELGLSLPFPLLISQPCLVDLVCQLAEDLVHFGEIDHLGGRREEEKDLDCDGWKKNSPGQAQSTDVSLEVSQEKLQTNIQTLLHSAQSNLVFTYTSLKLLVSYLFNPANEKWFERRRGSLQISNNSDKAPKTQHFSG